MLHLAEGASKTLVNERDVALALVKPVFSPRGCSVVAAVRLSVGRWKVPEGLRAGEATGVLADASLAEDEIFRSSKISQQEKGRGREIVGH